MKKNFIYLVASTLFVGAVFFLSCKKDEASGDVSSDVVSSASDVTSSTAMADEADAEVDDALLATNSDVKSAEADNNCKSVNKEFLTDKKWPRKVTIDFGTGCAGKSGRIKSGKIIVTVDKPFWWPGSTRVVTYDNFKVNDKRVEGTRTVTYKGLNEQGQPYWEISLVGGKITFKDSTSVTREYTRVRTMTAGYDTTSLKVDAVFSVTGQGSGTNRNGDAYTDRIVEPLIFSHNCKHVKTGSIEITVAGKDPFTITFENENCSGKAMIKQKDKSKNIDLD